MALMASGKTGVNSFALASAKTPFQVAQAQLTTFIRKLTACPSN
jgi:hypothetical protein